MPDVRERLDRALGARYRIVRELGSGGMAVVFLAEDLKHGRKVALKVLRPELAHDLAVERFLREIRIAAGLSHANILPLYDSGEADGLLYFVMPYVRGESLRELLKREGPLQVEAAVRLLSEIGAAIQRAHEAGVVHRDIKPGNVLIEDDRALVSDFGVARAVGAAAGEHLTKTGVAVGTLAYMSPEQATGEASQDARSDIYSLGCLAYEMLAGEPPFTGSTAQAVVAGHLARPVPSLRTRRKDLPGGVQYAIEHALAKDPSNRFGSALEFVQSLESAITEETRVADARRMRRRRWIRAAGALALVGGAALGGRWLTDRLQAPDIQRLAVLPASNLTRDTADDIFVDGVHEALVVELQRTGIPIVARQSVLQYRNSDLPIRQIAAQLGVDALIQPAVGKDGDSVVVDVSLIDARSELPIWTGEFASQLRDVLGLYRDVAGRVAGQIGTVLTTQATARLAERPVVDPRVIEAVYNGDFHLRRFNPQDFALALGYYQDALALDSLYAPAHVGVASVWAYRAQAGGVSAADAGPYIERHLASALRLDPDLPRAVLLQASAQVWRDWDVEGGERTMRRALELDPNDAEARAFYGHILMILGRWDDAIHQGELSTQVDPRNAFATGLRGTILTTTGRASEAIDLLTRMFQLNPGTGFGRNPLISALEQEGRYAEALEQVELQIPSQELRQALTDGYQAGGYPEAMRRLADARAQAARGGYVSAAAIALPYALAGDTDAALSWLEAAVEQRDQNMPYVGVHPSFRSLHGDARFQRLVDEIGVGIFTPDPS